jgi:hypothetical protein
MMQNMGAAMMSPSAAASPGAAQFISGVGSASGDSVSAERPVNPFSARCPVGSFNARCPVSPFSAKRTLAAALNPSAISTEALLGFGRFCAL